MDIGGALGAVTGLVGAGLSAQAQQTANVINMMNLQFQKENARRQYRLSTAARGDAYGNKQRYDDILNEWIMSLTPTQQKIVTAGETEQLRSLTEDAKRNRDIRRQQRARGLDAAKDYARVLAAYRFGGPKSELAIRDELTNLLAGVEREDAGRSKVEVMRAAIREGRGGDVGGIIKAFNDTAGRNMARIMLEAREKARGEFAQRSQFHAQQNLPVLAQLQQLMDLGGDMPQRFSDTPDKLMALQGQQAAAIQQALQSEAGNVGGAFKTLAGSMGKSPDLSGIAKSLSGGGGSRSRAKYQQPAYSVLQPDFYREEDRFTDDSGSF